MNLKEGQKAHSSPDREDSTVLADNVSRNKREENEETQSTFVLLARCVVVGARRLKDLLGRGFCWIPNPPSVLSPFGLFSTVTDCCGSAHEKSLLVLLLLC